LNLSQTAEASAAHISPEAQAYTSTKKSVAPVSFVPFVSFEGVSLELNLLTGMWLAGSRCGDPGAAGILMLQSRVFFTTGAGRMCKKVSTSNAENDCSPNRISTPIRTEPASRIARGE
jgi:hypothetical protein